MSAPAYDVDAPDAIPIGLDAADDAAAAAAAAADGRVRSPMLDVVRRMLLNVVEVESCFPSAISRLLERMASKRDLHPLKDAA